MVSRNIKAIPLLVTLLLSVLYVLYNPFITDDLSFYLSNGGENGFGASNGWAMYVFLIPAIGALLGRPKVMWRYIVIMAVFPIALCFSYWLWELLGWVVMGVALSMNVVLFVIGSDEDLSIDWAAVAMYCLCGVYAVLRVICYFANDTLLPVFDIAFMGLSALVCVADTAMVFGGWIPSKSMYNDDADLSAQTNFYYFIACAALLFGLSFASFDVHKSNPKSNHTNRQTVEAKTTTYVCTANSLNVRNMPNTSSQAIGKLTKGNQVEVYQILNEYAEIKFAGQKGYVSKRYITPIDQYRASTSTAAPAKTNTQPIASTTQKSAQTTTSQTPSVKPIPADAKKLYSGHKTQDPQVDDAGGDRIYAVTQGPGYTTVWFVVPRFNTFEVSSRTYLMAQNGTQNVRLKIKEMGEWTKAKGYSRFKLDVHHGEDYSSDRLFCLIFDEIDSSITTITVKDEKRNWAWDNIHLKSSR